MRICGVSLLVAGLAMFPGAALHAQENVANPSGVIIGPPQLKDFRLEPRERIVEQPPPQAENPPPPPVRSAPEPAPATSAAPPNAPRVAEVSPPRTEPPPRTAESGPSAPALAESQGALDAPEVEVAQPVPVVGKDATRLASEPGQAENGFNWFYALPVLVLAFLGVAAVRRRRYLPAVGPVEPPVGAGAAKPARPEPVLRPWLEIALKAERASLTDAEAEIAFELTLRNNGKEAARNVGINACMINAGADQDREVGQFFNSKGAGRRTFTLPVVEAGMEGILRGSVTMAREDMKAVTLEDRQLFIPLIAVNALYEWGEDGNGQTSKSYVIGREAAEPNGKMGPFRLDLGPRIWRSIGQRPHRLARRV